VAEEEGLPASYFLSRGFWNIGQALPLNPLIPSELRSPKFLNSWFKAVLSSDFPRCVTQVHLCFHEYFSINHFFFHNCASLGYYVANSANFLLTFRDKLRLLAV